MTRNIMNDNRQGGRRDNDITERESVRMGQDRVSITEYRDQNDAR